MARREQICGKTCACKEKVYTINFTNCKLYQRNIQIVCRSLSVGRRITHPASDKIIFDQSRDSLVRVFDPRIRFQSLGIRWLERRELTNENRQTRLVSYRRTFAASRDFRPVNSSENCQVLRDGTRRRTERGTKTARISRGQLADSSATMRQPSSSEDGSHPDAFWRGQKSRNRSIRHGRIVIFLATWDPFSDNDPSARIIKPPSTWAICFLLLFLLDILLAIFFLFRKLRRDKSTLGLQQIFRRFYTHQWLVLAQSVCFIGDEEVPWPCLRRRIPIQRKDCSCWCSPAAGEGKISEQG